MVNRIILALEKRYGIMPIPRYGVEVGEDGTVVELITLLVDGATVAEIRDGKIMEV